MPISEGDIHNMCSQFWGTIRHLKSIDTFELILRVQFGHGNSESVQHSYRRQWYQFLTNSVREILLKNQDRWGWSTTSCSNEWKSDWPVIVVLFSKIMTVGQMGNV
jgi:hypothetical protein